MANASKIKAGLRKGRAGKLVLNPQTGDVSRTQPEPEQASLAPVEEPTRSPRPVRAPMERFD